MTLTKRATRYTEVIYGGNEVTTGFSGLVEENGTMSSFFDKSVAIKKMGGFSVIRDVFNDSVSHQHCFANEEDKITFRAQMTPKYDTIQTTTKFPQQRTCILIRRKYLY